MKNLFHLSPFNIYALKSFKPTIYDNFPQSHQPYK